MELRTLQPLLDSGIEKYAVPGSQLGLLRGAERVVVSAGVCDQRGNRPVDGSTAFHAGSIAKALTGLVILDAARNGDIDLDAPCAAQGEGLWPETPRALLSQTTGRPNLLPENEEPIEDFVERVAPLPLVHTPGRFSYCNAGWSVLDLLLRRTTGRTFEQAATDALGDETTFGMPDGAAGGHIAIPGQDRVPAPAKYSPAASAAGSQWWATADQLLDFAALNLHGGSEVFVAEDVMSVRTPTAPLPGATVFDSWGMGWAVWDRDAHQAFGWAGYTGGHRAFLRCFPDHDAALVLLANSAGPLFGPPGGSALFDSLLPNLLELLGVPALGAPSYGDSTAADELAGSFGPLAVEARGPDLIELHAAPFGLSEPTLCERLGGDTFNVQGKPPGSTPLAFDAGDLIYLGPFALPRTSHGA